MEYLLIRVTETGGEFSVNINAKYKPVNMATHLAIAMREDIGLRQTLQAAVDAYNEKLTEGFGPVEVERHGRSSGD